MGCGIGWGWHLAWDLSPVCAHSLWAGLCPEKLVNINFITDDVSTEQIEETRSLHKESENEVLHLKGTVCLHTSILIR